MDATEMPMHVNSFGLPVKIHTKKQERKLLDAHRMYIFLRDDKAKEKKKKIRMST